MHLGTLSPTENDNKLVDLKQAAFQVTPIDTVTPSLTPTSPPKGEIMAGKKLYSLEKPDDRAKELASKLTLEEQVCVLISGKKQHCYVLDSVSALRSIVPKRGPRAWPPLQWLSLCMDSPTSCAICHKRPRLLLVGFYPITIWVDDTFLRRCCIESFRLAS